MTMRRRQAGLGVVLAIVMLVIPGLLAGLGRQPVQPVAAAHHTTTPGRLRMRSASTGAP
jgi:hypothetical protein